MMRDSRLSVLMDRSSDPAANSLECFDPEPSGCHRYVVVIDQGSLSVCH
jgi:hypothetical protein